MRNTYRYVVHGPLPQSYAPRNNNMNNIVIFLFTKKKRIRESTVLFGKDFNFRERV